jgi:adenylate cyclase
VSVLAAGMILGCGAALLLPGLRATRAHHRRRRLGRHHAPTFVFADLVGYTSLTEEFGDRAGALVARKFKEAISTLGHEHGALRLKFMGDGVMICAPDATQAVVLAARAVSELGGRPDLLPVRVGAHTGPAVLDGDDWFGGAVNLAARLAQTARPNEALVSQATRAALAEEHARWLSGHREVRLRGILNPVAVWRLTDRAATNGTGGRVRLERV